MGLIEIFVIILLIGVGYFIFTDKSKRPRDTTNSSPSDSQAKDIARMRQIAEWDRFDKNKKD